MYHSSVTDSHHDNLESSTRNLNYSQPSPLKKAAIWVIHLIQIYKMVKLLKEIVSCKSKVQSSEGIHFSEDDKNRSRVGLLYLGSAGQKNHWGGGSSKLTQKNKLALRTLTEQILKIHEFNIIYLQTLFILH